MDPSPQESALSGSKRMFEDLVRGQGCAQKLKDMFAAIGNNPDSEDELTMQDLVKGIRSSFDNSLLELSHEELGEASQVVVVARRARKRGKPSASEDSEGSVRSSLQTPRDRRGCYKRRSNGETWTKFTSAMSADVHQWRKYGQKPILNAAYPRNYFKCTHKSDQGCMATKQVQKISDDPIKFRTVYQGRHTCTDDRQLKSTEIVSDNYDISPVLISFECDNTITAPLKNEETTDHVFGNKGVVVPSASSDNDCFNILGLSGDTSFVASDPGAVMSSGHQDSYLDMLMVWDDTADFALDFGFAGDNIR